MSYEGTIDHLLDELGCLDYLLREFLGDRHRELPRSQLGLVERLQSNESHASPSATQLVVPEHARDDLERYRTRIEKKRRAAIEAGVDLRLQTLADAFDLTRQHLDVLLLALFPDVDPAGTELFSELQNDASKQRPTVRLVADLFSTTPDEFLTATELFGQGSPLHEYSLLVLDSPEGARQTGSKLDYSIRVDDRIYAFLLGHGTVDPGLRTPSSVQSADAVDAFLTETTADATLDDLLIEDDTYSTLASLRDSEESGRRLYFHGPRGSGPQRAAEALCEEDAYLQVDLPAVLEAGILDMVVREAALQARPVVVTGADEATSASADGDRSLSAVIDRFDPVVSDVFLLGESSWTPAGTSQQPVDALVGFDRPTIPLRRQFWQAHADDLPDDLDPERMASTFDLTLGQMESALAAANTLAGGDELTVEHVRKGCRAQSSSQLADLAQQITPTIAREEVMLRERTDKKLDQLQAHISNRGRIYDDWGFRDKEKNAGVVALFKGKPGTGKTMAAEALANEVGMHIYKIDLSSVVSKYIGETEENLEQIFQAAEQSNAILLFDEADSVFGDRAEVSDATDRYANAEVNYLLQRIETYDGVILLTTNYASNIDEAFTRRINHTVRFENPQEETREAIWEAAFPDETPTDGIDAEWLAQFDFSGGEIASLAKRIAVEAASCGDESIQMKHAVRVLERDYRDAGRVVRKSEFEPYDEALVEPAQEPDGRRRNRR
ncbi:ATP-binding protein [Halogeometricum borinquense]|uniref:ATP-binding protein n=1 Tax=Halogeometricum borinquense TaxID=60847 RepID=A0A6C0UL14_9EURY|nr:AAA family ATPase [Halogeometricum borinquense]QIB76124.1 ATP-binding protein [Halogeometricum borinquense]